MRRHAATGGLVLPLALFGCGGGAVDPGLDCAGIAREIGFETSLIADLGPGPVFYQNGPIAGRQREGVQLQTDRLKQQAAKRRIAMLRALERGKRCQGGS